MSDTRYVTHDTWVSWVATDMFYPDSSRITNAYDELYRRTEVAPFLGWGETIVRSYQEEIYNDLVKLCR